MITALDVKRALEELGVTEGDSIITHSSFKSVGPTEEGAKTIVDGMLLAVGKEGTVIFPTLCSNDWQNVYKNWTLDAPSDVGYLTNYFRCLPDAKRSNQATHSVAAIGRLADELTKTHGESGKRYGIFGDTPFSADSPWEKMYNLDTKMLFIGVGLRKCTLRHFVEYCVMNEYLEKAKKSEKYEELKDKLWTFEKNGEYVWDNQGIWPRIESEFIGTVLEPEGKLKRGRIGDAEVLLVSARDFADKARELMLQRHPSALSAYSGPIVYPWLDEIDAL